MNHRVLSSVLLLLASVFVTIIHGDFLRFTVLDASTSSPSNSNNRNIDDDHYSPPEIVLITPTRAQTNRLDNFELILQSFRNLTVYPDEFILFEDWNSDQSFAQTLMNYSLPFPVSVVPRPEDSVSGGEYPFHYYTGHLKTFVWWAINTAFATKNAKQVCYIEDDIVVHHEFLRWVTEVRSKVDRKDYWGVYGSGAAFYAPFCVDRFEWSLLLYYYQDFCFAENGAWDMLLFGLHQHGPLMAQRLESVGSMALHLPSKLDDIRKLQSEGVSMTEYELRTPHYSADDQEPSDYVDLNFKEFWGGSNRAQSKGHLMRIIDSCSTVALETQSQLEVKKRLLPIHEYEVLEGRDVMGINNSITSLSDEDPGFLKSTTICNHNVDCDGFARLGNTTWFKKAIHDPEVVLSNVEGVTLHRKVCARLKSSGGCVPHFEYIP